MGEHPSRPQPSPVPHWRRTRASSSATGHVNRSSEARGKPCANSCQVLEAEWDLVGAMAAVPPLFGAAPWKPLLWPRQPGKSHRKWSDSHKSQTTSSPSPQGLRLARMHLLAIRKSFFFG